MPTNSIEQKIAPNRPEMQVRLCVRAKGHYRALRLWLTRFGGLARRGILRPDWRGRRGSNSPNLNQRRWRGLGRTHSRLVLSSGGRVKIHRNAGRYDDQCVVAEIQFAGNAEDNRE